VTLLTQMSMSERLASLTPEQRALLEKRMKEKGIDTTIVKQQPPPNELMQKVAASFGKGRAQSGSPVTRPRHTDKGMDFSVFFFSGDGSTSHTNKYHLLLESAKFADKHGFSAVWTPERHFEEFGGLYPNPSVLSAGLATITERVQIRAGSVAIPLHNPVRFCEEWSVVDNLSGGRVSVSLATGWHPNDFVLAPTRTRDYYNNRKDVMFESMDLIRRLWSGEPVRLPGLDDEEVEVKILPRPLQPELELWIASQGNTETFIKAGEAGAHLLTGMVNQPLEVLEEKIRLYREARAKNGFDPEAGKVSVMLHTCLGASNDSVKALVREPMQEYLKTFIRQQKDILADYDTFSEADQDAVVSFAFEHYFEDVTLFGTVDKCSGLIENLIDIGVTEVACLVDFGIDMETVMNSFEHLVELKDRYTK